MMMMMVLMIMMIAKDFCLEEPPRPLRLLQGAEVALPAGAGLADGGWRGPGLRLPRLLLEAGHRPLFTDLHHRQARQCGPGRPQVRNNWFCRPVLCCAVL